MGALRSSTWAAREQIYSTKRKRIGRKIIDHDEAWVGRLVVTLLYINILGQAQNRGVWSSCMLGYCFCLSVTFSKRGCSWHYKNGKLSAFAYETQREFILAPYNAHSRVHPREQRASYCIVIPYHTLEAQP